MELLVKTSVLRISYTHETSFGVLCKNQATWPSRAAFPPATVRWSRGPGSPLRRGRRPGAQVTPGSSFHPLAPTGPGPPGGGSAAPEIQRPVYMVVFYPTGLRMPGRRNCVSFVPVALPDLIQQVALSRCTRTHKQGCPRCGQ